MYFNENQFRKYEFNRIMTKDWIFPFSSVKKGSNIILYGAGDVGQAYYEQICYTEYCSVIRWIDKNPDVYEGIGCLVEPPSNILKSEYDQVVIAVSDRLAAREVYEQLVENGVDQNKVVWLGEERITQRGNLVDNRLLIPIRTQIEGIYRRRGISPDNFEVDAYIKAIENGIKEGSMFIIPRLVVELTTMCSLRCIGCNNLMPMYKKSCHVPKEVIIRDIHKILENVDGIVTLELIGGEPFLYPSLKEILEEVVGIDSIKEIELTTNGTIIPDEYVLNLLNNTKITVKVSKYESVNYKNDISQLFFDKGIRYEINKEQKWVDSGGVERRNRSRDSLKKTYMKCSAAVYCKTLYRGRLFSCARAASLFDLGVCSNEEEYLDIYKTNNLRKDIRTFWLKTIDESCDYCDFTDYWRIIDAGVQVQGNQKSK